MNKYKMNIKSINILKVVILILQIVLIILIKYIMYIMKIEDQLSVIIFGIMIFINIAINLICNMILIPMWFRRKEYIVSEKYVSLKKGVFIISRQYIKISNIQYVTSQHIPVFYKYGFNFIVFNSSIGKMKFIFISQKDADEILAYVKEKIGTKKNFSEE